MRTENRWWRSECPGPRQRERTFRDSTRGVPRSRTTTRSPATSPVLITRLRAARRGRLIIIITTTRITTTVGIIAAREEAEIEMEAVEMEEAVEIETAVVVPSEEVVVATAEETTSQGSSRIGTRPVAVDVMEDLVSPRGD